MMLRLIFITGLVTLIACSGTNENSQETQKAIASEVETKEIQYPELLDKALNAHGGLDTWQKYGQLTYTLQPSPNEAEVERHIINLYNRKVLIDRDSAQIGFDGSQVWVAPNLSSFKGSSARFYHNLYFYFFGIPYLLADPGINYEDLGLKTISGKDYRALKISYEKGVGDSDGDVYIAHFNPASYQLELLLYTVTYFGGSGESYNALVYDNWVTKDGLLIPKGFTGHKFENDSIGDKRYEVKFKDVKFAIDQPADSLFTRPKDSEISPLEQE